MAVMFLEKRNTSPLDRFLDAECCGAVGAGSGDPVLYRFVEPVRPMVGLAQLGHPTDAGAIEDEDDVVARLLEFLTVSRALTARARSPWV
jgi:hypothetical protein